MRSVDTAASSITREGAALARPRARARRTAGSASRPTYGRTESRTAPGQESRATASRNDRARRGHRRRARRSAAARRRRRADARASRPLRRSCVSMRSSRYGRSPTSSRKSTQPAGGVERERRAERASELRQRAADEHPGASPARIVSSCGCAELAQPARPAQAAQERVAVVPAAPLASRPSSIGP